MNPNIFLQKKVSGALNYYRMAMLVLEEKKSLSNEPHDFFKDYKSSFWGMAIV